MNGRHLFFGVLVLLTVIAVALLWLPLISPWVDAFRTWPPTLPVFSWAALQGAGIVTFLLYTSYSVVTQLVLMWASEKDSTVGVVSEPPRTPSRTGLGPAVSCFDEGATAGAKFYIGLLAVPYLQALLTSGFDATVISAVGVLVVLLLLYLFGSAFRYLIQALNRILRSPVLLTVLNWKTVSK